MGTFRKSGIIILVAVAAITIPAGVASASTFSVGASASAMSPAAADVFFAPMLDVMAVKPGGPPVGEQPGGCTVTPKDALIAVMVCDQKPNDPLGSNPGSSSPLASSPLADSGGGSPSPAVVDPVTLAGLSGQDLVVVQDLVAASGPGLITLDVLGSNGAANVQNPEPASLVLLGTGLISLVAARRRARNKRSPRL